LPLVGFLSFGDLFAEAHHFWIICSGSFPISLYLDYTRGV